MKETREMAEFYGFVIPANYSAAGQQSWRISDVRSSHYGELVPPEATNDPDAFVARDAVALVKVDGHWLHAVRIEEKNVGGPTVRGAPQPVISWDSYRQLGSGSSARDAMLLGDERDSRGVRYLDFRAAVERSRPEVFKGFPLSGPHVAPELAIAIRDAGQPGFEAHHLAWVTRSGAGDKCAAVRDHRLWSLVLSLGTCFDQYDFANSSAMELAARRLTQIETAVKRNPKFPDYEGLDGMLEASVDSSGVAYAPAFTSWFAEKRRSQATIMKADRQYREELVAQRKAGKGKEDA